MFTVLYPPYLLQILSNLDILFMLPICKAFHTHNLVTFLCRIGVVLVDFTMSDQKEVLLQVVPRLLSKGASHVKNHLYLSPTVQHCCV